MNIKLVVVVALSLVILVSAKPNKKGKKNDKSLLEQYIELCEGLQDGEIENTEAEYDDVFTQFNTTCTDILAYSEEAQAIETLAKESNKSGKKGGKKGGKGKGGKKNKENKAVERLMAICISIGVQNYLESFPDDTPNELKDIYVNDTYPICQEAYEIKTGGFEVGFIKLCKTFDDGKIKNTNPKYQLWFDWIEPVCESYNVTTEEDGIESDAEVSIY
ncbi:uncharacterized protein LOC132740538 [Ruditapes philippinarum]|uniref:uncharacterized protein LOC132740538 n=1 Tax=Ruditapes philippinarum TaxID=129788 RepID=UPI00295AB207|nr:uncharacterized protein LOC132740538 [Ruditapes philippinarum]